MRKPDFGKVDRRIDWTKDRIDWVRYLAGQQKTAREIALDIGLAPNQAPRIFELCRRCDIALNGQGGRRAPPPAADALVFRVAIRGGNIAALKRLTDRHSMHPGAFAELLVNAAIEQGETFCENMLDLEAGA